MQVSPEMDAFLLFRGRPSAYFCALAALLVGGCSSGGADLYPHRDGGPDLSVGRDGGTGSCQAPLIICDGKCTDPLTSAQHCGASGDCRGGNAGASCQPVTGQC